MPAAIQADDPGRAAADLASILSGTATPAQCRAFQEAAMRSSAVRLEAQSALAFLNRIDAAPLAAPAHLVAQTLASAGGAPPRSRPGIWSRLMRRPGRQVVAACAVMLMAGGVSWSLLWRGGLTTDGVPVPPATGPQAAGTAQGHRAGTRARGVAGPIGSDAAGCHRPARNCPTRSELPARPVAPLSVSPRSVQPAAPAFATGARGCPIAAIAGAGAHRSVRAAQRRGSGFPSALQGREPRPPSPRRASPREPRRVGAPDPVRCRCRCGRGRPGPDPGREAGREGRQVRSHCACGHRHRRPHTRPPPPPSAQPRSCRRVSLRASLERAAIRPSSLPLKGGGWRRRRRVGSRLPAHSELVDGTPTRPALRVDLPLSGGG